jgi:glutamate-1-semialdehyde 2,1-aminomutase
MSSVIDSSTASASLFARAQQLLPGGVNSPVRAFRAVGGTPRFIARAQGARVWDEDGHELLDYIGAWGPHLLGHGHPAIVGAVRRQAEIATSVGMPTRLEVEMAETLVGLVPSLEMVRMVNSGTEATMAALRVARGATGRTAVLKFEGCYHGHGDSFLVKAGSGAATFGTPDSPGVTPATAHDTLTARFNDLESVRAMFAAHADRLAAVIVEPVVGNMGVVAPAPGLHPRLRDLCTANRTHQIIDEVMNGFRVARGGAQERYGVTPDLTTLGKIIGGGLPVGAFGGRRDLMARVSPSGPIYQAGTMSGNPLAMAAGLAALHTIERDRELYPRLEALGAQLEEGITQAIAARRLPCGLARVGSMWTIFFTASPVTSWDDAKAADTARFGRYFAELLARGVLVAPSQFEANFISAAHTSDDIAWTISAIVHSLEAAHA